MTTPRKQQDPNQSHNTFDAARRRGGRRRQTNTGGASGKGKRRTSGSRSSNRFRNSDVANRAPQQPEAASAPQEHLSQSSKIQISEVVSVRDLAAALGTTPIEIIKILMSYGTMATINEIIDFETATIVAEELGREIERETIVEEPAEEGSAGPLTLRERLLEMEDNPENLKPRPPVVTVLGHVDHGKTTLLDVIRDTDVVGSESGGITQHIAAYQITLDGRKITFLDTPGHAAFTAMRARGAQVTDVVILVVAADDGVMPQTQEAIDHARAARVPIVVALNKIDKPNANPDHVKQQLADVGLQPEEWGGDTIVVPISAKQRINIETLLENVLLVADVLDLKANPEGSAVGTVIESNQDRRLGNVATVLVQKGALHRSDPLVVGDEWGRIRAMFDYHGRKLTEALPSLPVLITGLQGLPHAGDIFQVVESDKLARQISNERKLKARAADFSQQSKTVTLEDIYNQIQGGMKDLNVIIKVDVEGSLEPIVNSLQELSNDEVQIRVLRQAVGNITEGDVMLAAASRALILGFNVQIDPVAHRIAEKEGVDIRTYDVIYHLIEDIGKALQGLLEPIYEDQELGRAEVRAIFRIRGKGKVLGCLVTDGVVQRGAEATILRSGKAYAHGVIDSLKRYQEDVTEVRAGYECGLTVSGFNDPQEGDIVVATEKVRVR
ncbi:MAG: translation initiation factor IF-2 [Clostridia bacterium]|nr:MAG: translation initiation factor IF-2 [Clostridia bacterium]